MTNYDRYRQEKMNDPEFAKAYHEEKRKLDLEEELEELKQKVLNSEPKEEIVKNIENIMAYLQKG